MRDSTRSLSLTLVALLALLLLQACDTTENPDLLNPPTPDSTRMRAVNLVSGTDIGLTVGGLEVVRSLGSHTVSEERGGLFTEPVAVVIDLGDRQDTIPPAPFPSAIGDELLMTYAVLGTPESPTLAPILTSRIESATLAEVGSGRIVFLNGIPDRSFDLRLGCRNGRSLFAGIAGGASGGSVDLQQGDASLYLIPSGDINPAATAKVTLDAGSIIALACIKNNSGDIELVTVDLGLETSSPGPVAPTQPESRTTAEMRVLNAVAGSTLDVVVASNGGSIATALPSGTISDAASAEVCAGTEPDSIDVIDGADTARLPIEPVIGEQRTVALYSTPSGIQATTLPPFVAADEGTLRLRGINLATNDSILSIQFGAGSPGKGAEGAILFSQMRIGRTTGSVLATPGLTALALEIATSGQFLDGGLESLDGGSWLLIALPGADSPELHLLREDFPGSTLTLPNRKAVRSVVFSTATGPASDVSISTSIGTLSLPDIAYSFVYPTLLPIESVTISSNGTAPAQIDVPTDGLVVGLTGSESDRRLLVHPRISSPPPSDRTAIRFLSARPGAPSIAVREASIEGEVLATIDFDRPSPSIERIEQQASFAFTPVGTNDELARINGLQLSPGRNYLLVLGPAGVTEPTGREYATLLLQE